jgi:hypothetical protein
MTMRRLILATAAVLLLAGAADAGPAWGPPGWNNGPLDPSPPPKAKCYRTVRYCTEVLSDGHCKLWDSHQVEVAC